MCLGFCRILRLDTSILSEGTRKEKKKEGKVVDVFWRYPCQTGWLGPTVAHLDDAPFVRGRAEF